MAANPGFDDVLDAVEHLPPDEQAELVASFNADWPNKAASASLPTYGKPSPNSPAAKPSP